LRKVLGYEIDQDEIKQLVSGTKGAIEKALMKVKLKIDRKKKARPAEKKSVIRKTAGTDSR